MELKNIDNIHIGNKISELIKLNNISVYNTLSPAIKKTPAGIYKDFEKSDLSLKQVYAYLKNIDMDFCEFLSSIGICKEKEVPLLMKDMDFQYNTSPKEDSSTLKREIELLSKLVDEKERMIQLLSKGKFNK
ncbi:MAG: hypothetical protein H7329_07190 [Opitutaceae bacterium]|nr:hypothetical protein [Cytophagales bacterium]